MTIYTFDAQFLADLHIAPVDPITAAVFADYSRRPMPAQPVPAVEITMAQIARDLWRCVFGVKR
jgi:hypothetical protein